MTISTTTNKVTLQGNGSTTSFPFTFPIPAANELAVYHTTAGGAVTLLPSSQYSVTGIGASTTSGGAVGGSVTYPLSGSPIPSGDSITILRTMPYQQLTSLVNQSGYYPDVVEAAMDNLEMQLQQIATGTSNAYQPPIVDSNPSTVLPPAAQRANNIFAFDVNGNPTMVSMPATVGAGNLTAEIGSNGRPGFKAGVDFTAGTTSSLTLSKAYGSVNNVQVYFDTLYVEKDNLQLVGQVLTYGSYVSGNFVAAPIPVGINNVDVIGGTTLSLVTPGTGTVTDASVSPSAAIQSSKLSFLQGGTGAVSRTVQSKLRDRVSVLDFGADNTGTNDSTAAIAAAWAYVSANPQKMQLVFPQGVYLASSFPNFAVNHARVIAEGEVRLRYTGTGTAIALDAGAASLNVYDVTFGTPGNPLIVESDSVTSNCVFVRAVHHSMICVNARTAGASSAGLAVNFAVCTKFYVTCSVNEDGGWYNNQKPTYGIYLTQRNAAEQVSYCTFYTPVIEGPTNGIYLDYADGNLFLGGTSEACSNIGVTLTANATRNTFHNMDFEVNAVSDWDDSGVQNSMIKCDTNVLASLKGTNGEIHGGAHNAITISASSTGAWIHDLRYNRNGNGSIISDSGVLTRKQGCMNAGSGLYDGPASAFAITPSAGTYTNNRTVNVGIAMTGGTVTNVTLVRGGTSTTVYSGTSLGSGIFETSPGDVLNWSGTPSVANGYPRVSV